MPARQDQTLQIFLIIFIFAFLVAAVVAFLGWRGYSEASTRATALQTSLNQQTSDSQSKSAELEDMRRTIGFGANDSAADVKKAAEQDMKTYGAPVGDEASRTYRKVMETLYGELQATAAREAELKQKLSDVSKDLMAVKTEAQKQIDEYKAEAAKAQEDLASEKNSFAQYRQSLENGQRQLQKSLDDQRTNYEAQIAKNNATIKDLEDRIGKQEHSIQLFKDQRKDEPGSFEVADGQITYVDQNGTAIINLGSADSLRREVTFSVYDADRHDAAKATKKGSIEVTRILGDHMAEARITKDDATNPILTGDNIYSQVWHRGKKLHFALTGVIDIDGDGQSDLRLARDLIEMNGGIVDAYLGEDGKVHGEIDANTRFLVLGDVPESAVKSVMQQGYHEMSKTASSLGVQTITLPEFIDEMGYKPQDRTVRLGTGAKASDFPPRPDQGAGPAKSPVRFRSGQTTAPAATSGGTP
ncbi:MAG TPA: hypothetical protein VHE81_04915 [Lacipirellulaceae bacterium]|nr:hypothetical protein [Lacipirellulaceae bacterium]